MSSRAGLHVAVVKGGRSASDQYQSIGRECAAARVV